MPLSADPRKIVKAKVALCEAEHSQRRYCVDWETSDGLKGTDLIGSKAEAEAVLREIEAKRAAPADIIVFPKDVAAS